jgi:hypothetical protein
MRITLFILQLGLAVLIMRCTSNPFGGDEITFGYRQVKGNVKLNDGSNPEGVYVWIEGFNEGTYTDTDGEFTLILPSQSSAGPSGGLSGLYTMYFYCANYELDSAQAVVQDGEFVYSRGNINKNGRIAPPIELERFLRIETWIEPSSVRTTYSGNIEVNVELTATQDTATVITPYALPDEMGAVLVKKVDTDDIFIFTTMQYSTARIRLLVTEESVVLPMTFNTVYTQLPVGNYEVIPYIIIFHEEIPEDLINSLGSNVLQLGPNYLKVPFKRIGGDFRVK